MKYIILAAGVGSRLYPYTKNYPKCLVQLSPNETIIERCVRKIKEHDKSSEITIVTGFKSDSIISKEIKEVNYVNNPFYKVTNSIASLWMAKDFMIGTDDVVILNADVVFSNDFAKDITTQAMESTIYFDSSIKQDGDYNVKCYNENIIVMGKELVDYDGEYCGITKIANKDLISIIKQIDSMIMDGLYDQWYENALVQLMLNKEIAFIAKDANEYNWSEIDSINNLFKIRSIVD